MGSSPTSLEELKTGESITLRYRSNKRISQSIITRNDFLGNSHEDIIEKERYETETEVRKRIVEVGLAHGARITNLVTMKRKDSKNIDYTEISATFVKIE